jgi:RNA polymerase sigma-70 factor, ECF subfamily
VIVLTDAGDTSTGGPPPNPAELGGDLAGAGWLEAVAEHRDRDAFTRLFAFYAPRVKGHLLRRGAPDETAEELTQEVMLSIWRRAPQFDRTRGTAGAWIFTIARNCFVNRLRRQRYPEVELDDPALARLSGESAAPSADEQVGAVADHQALYRALGELPDEQRHAVEAAYIREEKLRQVAEAQQVPLGTVKTRLRLALQKLGRSLTRTGRAE